MWEPRSIFTGIDTTTPLDTTPDQRRLKFAWNHDPLVTSPTTPDPPIVVDKTSNLPILQPPWTPKSPLDRRDCNQPPASALLHSGRQHGAEQTLRTPPPAVIGTKRPPPPFSDYAPAASTSPRPPEPASEPLHKRRKAHPRLRHSLDHVGFSKSAQFRLDNQPTSPLFFSSRNTRPQLPTRFSSSEAAASMLSKTREDSGIKTVTLARGSFSGLSPPGPAGGASGRISERSSLPPTASPDSREKTDPLRILGSIGIVELLEQDERPTFIVDTGDFANYMPDSSSLQILFSNSALRYNSSTWELVAGKQTGSHSDNDTAHATQQFRGWLLSNGVQGDNSGGNPSPVEHGGIVWTCYTLRKRLRVVSGTVSAPAIVLPATDGPNDFAIPSTSSAGLGSGANGDTSLSVTHQSGLQDYFGNTIPAVSPGEPTPPVSAPQPEQGNKTFVDKGNSMVPRPSQIDISSAEASPSFVNECVLRGHTAGDVDPFCRETNTHSDEYHDMGFFDWTRLAMSPSLPRHIQFARSIDWASTPLGPIEYWSNDLRAMCNLIM
jgi:hypothetical protein